MLRLFSTQRARTYVARFERGLQVNWNSPCFPCRQFSCSIYPRDNDLQTSCSSILKNIQQYTTDHPFSIFTSTTNNPYHNLAIENYILRYSEPNSSILFTYVNRPCIVFGRNQNPWLEINITRAQQGLLWNPSDWQEYRTIYSSEEGEITSAQNGRAVALDLVRRRSGGGTVIHDAGNLNFSFIVPNDKDFTRNKHARLIVAALQSYLEQAGSQPAYYGKDDIYVNERHDIAMKLNGQALKVSGSAFKLTKGRALHHGTLLLASPNISSKSEASDKQGKSIFSQLLSSPAKSFLEAKGVGSVSSPVHNLFAIDPDLASEEASMKRRRLIRGVKTAIVGTFKSAHREFEDFDVVALGDEAMTGESRVDAICMDVQEMMTDAWRWGQTPTFSYKFSQDQTTISFQARQSVISGAELESTHISRAEAQEFSKINGKLLHEIDSWQDYIPLKMHGRTQLLEHLSRTFPSLYSSMTGKPEIEVLDNIAQEETLATGGGVIRHATGQAEREIEEDQSNTIVQN